MKRTVKRTSKATARKQTKTGAKKSVFHKILTAEGWKRLMMGRMGKKSAKKK